MPVTTEKKFWKAKSSAGRKPTFKSSEQLLEMCLEYFEWCDNNPLLESKLCSFQGDNVLEEIPKMRVTTIGGLCLFLDISLDCWCTYRKKDGFLDVTAAVDNAIRENKFAGAAANLLNANIIARDLGLKDETGPTVIIHNNLTPEEQLKERGIPVPEIETEDVKDVEAEQKEEGDKDNA